MMSKSKAFDAWILNIILLLYPVEQFTVVHIDNVLGSFSPFRIVILPLCILYIILRCRSGIKADSPYMIGVYLFFGFSLLFVTVGGTFTSSLSFIGNILQFAMAFLLIRNINFNRSTLYIITLWCITQIPSLLSAFINNRLGMSQRFTGLFFDPNYLCAFVNGAIVSAAYLFSKEKNKLLKLYNLMVIALGLIMIFMSYSRSGMLGILLIAVIYLFVYNKKLLTIVVLISIPVVSALFVKAQFITWQDGADNFFNGFLYRTFTLSRDMSELTAERSDFAAEFYKHLDEYFFIGTDITTYLDKYNGGHFVHNGFLEIMIQGGVLFGGVFLVILLSSIVKEVLMANRYHLLSVELLICLAILIPMTTLSYSSKLAWLCMGGIISLAAKKVFLNVNLRSQDLKN